MKTIKELKQSIADIKYKIENDGDMKPSVEKRLRKQIPFLNHCIMYLESSPSEMFMKSEIEKVEAKISRRMALFIFDESLALPKTMVTKMKREHEKKYDVPKLREQVRTLRFLLK